MMVYKFCVNCDKPLANEWGRPQSKYCSRRCTSSSARKRYEPKKVLIGIPTGTVGAIAELMVATDLLSKGYDVYRALSQASAADLVILCEGKLIRLEVRTGHRLAGKITWTKTRQDVGRYDHYAIVLHNTKEIFYEPDLPMPLPPKD